MGVYKIDTFGIKSILFTIIISLLAVVYFSIIAFYIKQCEDENLVTPNTTKYAYYMSIISAVVSGGIFLYSFIKFYFTGMTFDPNIYSSNTTRIIGVFFFSLFIFINIAINTYIFDKGRVYDGAGVYFKENMRNAMIFSIFVMLFVVFYMFYYIYINVIKSSAYLPNFDFTRAKKVGAGIQGREDDIYTPEDFMSPQTKGRKKGKSFFKTRDDVVTSPYAMSEDEYMR